MAAFIGIDYSDPIAVSLAAIQTGVTAVGAAAGIAKWWGDRQESKAATAAAGGPTAAPEGAPGEQYYYRQDVLDIMYVLATLGQRLLALDVVHFAALPAARDATRQAFQMGDPEHEDVLGQEFDRAGDIVQYAVTCAMVFCAECWPMHVWQGFGCGVFNHLTWADPRNCNTYCRQTDTAIIALHAKTRGWQLLTKSPVKVAAGAVTHLDKHPKELRKQLRAVWRDVVAEYERRGFPQPLDRTDIAIKYWHIPYATWGGARMYENIGHDVEPICAYQQDPGRFLFAWTVGRRAELRPGEAILLPSPHIAWLADWLEGLGGMTFKVLRDEQLDHTQLKLKASNRKYLKRQTGSEVGIAGMPLVMVPDPQAAVVPVAEQFQKVDLGASDRKSMMSSTTSVGSDTPTSPTADRPPGYSSQPTSPVSPASPISPIALSSPSIRRRPVPLPPPAVLRQVVAQHDFRAQTEDELSFAAGDALDILDDRAEDGWWKARLHGTVGVVPSTFL